jgi:hypothetical protein
MQIALARTVAARRQVAFKTVADVVEWPRIIRSIKSVELLIPGPVRAGTRLREQRILFGHETTEELRIAEIERPRRLRLVAENREIDYELDHLIDSLGVGSAGFPEQIRNCYGPRAAFRHLALHGDQVARRVGARPRRPGCSHLREIHRIDPARSRTQKQIARTLRPGPPNHSGCVYMRLDARQCPLTRRLLA